MVDRGYLRFLVILFETTTLSQNLQIVARTHVSMSDVVTVHTVVRCVKLSHLAHQYDKPRVSVVIPVIDTHLQYLPDAVDSVEAQSMRDYTVVRCGCLVV